MIFWSWKIEPKSRFLTISFDSKNQSWNFWSNMKSSWIYYQQTIAKTNPTKNMAWNTKKKYISSCLNTYDHYCSWVEFRFKSEWLPKSETTIDIILLGTEPFIWPKYDIVFASYFLKHDFLKKLILKGINTRTKASSMKNNETTSCYEIKSIKSM